MSLSSMKFPDMLNRKPKYIEVMATADSSVIKFHGKEKSEKYILTLMNIVSTMMTQNLPGVISVRILQNNLEMPFENKIPVTTRVKFLVTQERREAASFSLE